MFLLYTQCQIFTMCKNLRALGLSSICTYIRNHLKIITENIKNVNNNNNNNNNNKNNNNDISNKLVIKAMS